MDSQRSAPAGASATHGQGESAIDVWCDAPGRVTIDETPRGVGASSLGGVATMAQEPGTVIEGVDFALVAYREEGVWQVEEIAEDLAEDLDHLAGELRRYPGDGGSLGLVSVDEDFFLIVRVLGPQVKLLLSDVSAASDWPIARAVVDQLDLVLPEDEDEQEPAGDLSIVADLGMGAMDMGALLDDFDLYPDEMLSDIASRLGFGRQYDELVGVTAAP